MTNFPTADTICKEYLRIANENIQGGIEAKVAYTELANKLIANPELLAVFLMVMRLNGMGSVIGLFVDGITIGMALAEKRQLEELAKL